MAARRKSVAGKEVPRTPPLFDIKVSATTDRVEWEKQYVALESKVLVPTIEGASVMNLSAMRACLSPAQMRGTPPSTASPSRNGKRGNSSKRR